MAGNFAVMRGVFVALAALGLVGLSLAGCGRSRFEQREAWRSQAEEACLRSGLVRSSAYMALGGPVQGPGTCGMDHAFRITAFAQGSVAVTQRVTLACPVIPHIEAWLAEVVQPAARSIFGARVVEVKSGSYACRSRNNQRGARLSEHSFGNALDVHSFRLSDGREITIARGWRGQPEEQDFLREVFLGACNHFTTVLGPGADPFHYDHLHLDRARHDPRGERHVCKPVIKYTPRAVPAPARRPAPYTAAPVEQPTIEQDEDPFEVGEGGARTGIPARTLQPAYARQTPLLPAQRPAMAAGSARDPHIAVASRERSVPPSSGRGEPTPLDRALADPIVLQPQLLNGEGIY